MLFDIANSGFSVTGIELSYHMLIASYAFLYDLKNIQRHTIFPWVDNTINNFNLNNQLYSCTFPDNSALELVDQTKCLDITIYQGHFLYVLKYLNTF